VNYICSMLKYQPPPFSIERGCSNGCAVEPLPHWQGRVWTSLISLALVWDVISGYAVRLVVGEGA
jgi:hypothetical protein